MTQDGVGQVWFLQVLDLFLRRFDIERLWSFMNTLAGNLLVYDPLTNYLLQVLKLCRPNDWSSDSLETPGDGNLGHLYPLLLSQLLDTGSSEYSLDKGMWWVFLTVERSPRTHCCLGRFQTRWGNYGLGFVHVVLETYGSVIERALVSFQGRVSVPLAKGLQGMHPTPRC